MPNDLPGYYIHSQHCTEEMTEYSSYISEVKVWSNNDERSVSPKSKGFLSAQNMKVHREGALEKHSF